jgi:small redox-active disulfide protein 2
VKIEVLGTGCPKCQKLYENVNEAVGSVGIAAEIIKVTNLSEISNYGVMLTPALVIDGVVKAVGKVPAIDEIKEWVKIGS